jgi:hypothetical protein
VGTWNNTFEVGIRSRESSKELDSLRPNKIIQHLKRGLIQDFTEKVKEILTKCRIFEVSIRQWNWDKRISFMVNLPVVVPENNVVTAIYVAQRNVTYPHLSFKKKNFINIKQFPGFKELRSGLQAVDDTWDTRQYLKKKLANDIYQELENETRSANIRLTQDVFGLLRSDEFKAAILKRVRTRLKIKLNRELSNFRGFVHPDVVHELIDELYVGDMMEE